MQNSGNKMEFGTIYGVDYRDEKIRTPGMLPARFPSVACEKIFVTLRERAGSNRNKSSAADPFRQMEPFLR
jgi:hypothetical protein